MTKLAGNLPTGDKNGLTAIGSQLIKEPWRNHVVIAIVDCKKTVRDNDTGDVEPTVRVLRVEVVRDEDELKTAEQILRRNLERRMGLSVLPLEVEDELDELFARLGDLTVDTETGEIVAGPEPTDDQGDEEAAGE